MVPRGCGRLLAALAGLAIVLTACSGGPAATPTARETTTAARTTATTPPFVTPTPAPVTGADLDVADPVLRDELLEMRRADQQERTGEGLPPGTKVPPIQDYARAERLKEIIADVGWPTIDLVGPGAASAAWLVAQHADHDVAFQQQALALLAVAADAGQADPIDRAYLEDRVAVNTGAPQRFGTQIRCTAGEPQPSTPLVDPAGVDNLRAGVGLAPLADYYAELAMMCAQEEADGEESGG